MFIVAVWRHNMWFKFTFGTQNIVSSMSEVKNITISSLFLAIDCPRLGEIQVSLFLEWAVNSFIC